MLEAGCRAGANFNIGKMSPTALIGFNAMLFVLTRLVRLGTVSTNLVLLNYIQVSGLGSYSRN